MAEKYEITPDDVREEAKVQRGTGDVESITIDRAKNGYTASIRYATKRGKANEPGPYVEPEKLVFNDIESLLEHLEGCL